MMFRARSIPLRGASIRTIAVLLFVAAVSLTLPLAKAHLLVAPPHSHDPTAVTWADGHVPIDTHQHQHRTDHDPRAGVKIHSVGAGAAAYVATKVWVDRTVLTFAAGPDHAANEFAHGHQDIPARYDTHPAVAGGDISADEAAEWNAFAAARVFDAFNGIGANDGWLDVGNATGPSNWHGTDDDEAPPPPGGVPWHSSVNWVAVDGTGAHELHVIYGEANDFCAGDNLACAFVAPGHASEMTIVMDDDEPWYYGVNTDPTVAPNENDFATVILHEVGHVIGFGHFGSFAAGQIMSIEPRGPRNTFGGIDHTIDADAIHGVRDLYAIAIPEPGAGLLLLLGMGSLFSAKRIRPA